MSLGWPALIPRNNSPRWPVMCRNRQWNTGSRLDYRTRPSCLLLVRRCKFGLGRAPDESIKPVHAAFPAINSIARCSIFSPPLFFSPLSLSLSVPPFIPAWDKKNLLIKWTTACAHRRSRGSVIIEGLSLIPGILGRDGRFFGAVGRVIDFSMDGFLRQMLYGASYLSSFYFLAPL